MTTPSDDAEARGDLTSLPVLEAYFANILPADPNALISVARDSDAPDGLINALIRLPSTERYESAEQLSAALTDGPL